MADSLLRSYLISIGFQVNQTQGKKFEKDLEGWDKRAAMLGKTLLGAAGAAAAMAAQFTYSMERLYYASRRTDSAVGNLQALDYAARQVGVKNIQQSMEALARNLRSNPGLTGLLNSLGVRVTGRDKSDVLMDLVGQLKKMPFFVAERYANLFGIDPDTLFMLQDGIDKMKEANAQRKQWAQDLGVDGDKAAASARDIANSWRQVTEHGSIFVDSVLIRSLPLLQKMADATNQMLDSWTKLLSGKSGSGDFFQDMWDGLFAEKVGRVELTEDAKRRLGATGENSYISQFDQNGVQLSPEANRRLGLSDKEQSQKKGWFRQKYEAFMRATGAKGYQPNAGDERSIDAATDDTRKATGGTAPPAGALADGGPLPSAKASKAEQERQRQAAAAAAPLFARLEKQYGLPSGWLGRVWAQESARGGNMLSSAGAQGHFQFMPATARQYGLDDPNNLEQSATAASKYYAYLLKKYDGDERKAAAAYNWGEGNLDKYGLGRAPSETRGYMDAVAGSGSAGGINQTNHITVQGVRDPDKAAAAVKESVDQANAEITRNQRVKVH